MELGSKTKEESEEVGRKWSWGVKRRGIAGVGGVSLSLAVKFKGIARGGSKI